MATSSARLVQPKKAFVWMVRHGQAVGNGRSVVNGNRIDAPLTPEGKKQARQLAREWKLHKPQVLLASPLTRAVATARELARIWHLPLHLTKLAEEQDYGPRWSGQPIHELVAQKELKRRFSFAKTGQIHAISPPAGESWSRLKRRAARLLAMLDRQYAGKRVVVVSHSDFIICCIGVRRGIADREILARPDIPNCGCIRL